VFLSSSFGETAENQKIRKIFRIKIHRIHRNATPIFFLLDIFVFVWVFGVRP
jgi:hypothetical protein